MGDDEEEKNCPRGDGEHPFRGNGGRRRLLLEARRPIDLGLMMTGNGDDEEEGRLRMKKKERSREE